MKKEMFRGIDKDIIEKTYQRVLKNNKISGGR